MAERRERILATAREIIAEQGFEALTLRQLAQTAGVTVPTIYNLIGSKDQVLVAAVAEQTERFLRGIQRAAGDVIAVVDANLRELLRMPRYYRSLLRLLMTSDAAEEARRTVSRALGGQLRAALGELAEQGGIEDWVDLDDLGDQLLGILGGASLAWAQGFLSDRAFGRRERYGVSLLMLGVTRGAARAAYLRLAQENQPRSPVREQAGVTSLKARR